jgi:hypothetical protein
MAKTKKAKRPARKRSERLPLDDPRWVPLIDAYKLLSPQAGFATYDLLAALRSDKLRCMRRSMTNPSERERVSASFWQDVEIDESMINLGRIRIYRAPRIRVIPEKLYPVPGMPLGEGWAFFVWKPDFDTIWSKPLLDKVKSDQQQPIIRQGQPPGPEATKNWRLEVARECIRRAEARETRPTAPAMIRFCKNKLDHEPDDRDMRKLLKFLYGG